jgi:hypothetical protein
VEGRKRREKAEDEAYTDGERDVLTCECEGSKYGWISRKEREEKTNQTRCQQPK